MASSCSQEYFNKLSESVDNDITKASQLQARLGNFFKNNPSEVLLNSKKFAGIVESNGVEAPLGGPINFNANNIVNAQGTRFMSDEFPFWDIPTKTKEPVENDENVKEHFENNENVEEHFENNENVKEHFDNSTSYNTFKFICIMLLIISLIIISLI